MKTYKIYDVPNGRINDFSKGYTGAGYPDACKLLGEYETIEECRKAFKVQVDLAFDPDGALNCAIFDAVTDRGLSDEIANAAASAAVEAAKGEALVEATEGDDPASWSYDLGDLHYLRVRIEEA